MSETEQLTETVSAEVRDRVLVVRIDREAKRNAIDPSITEGIGAALDRLDDDPELWAGVLTGTTAVFSAGTDLKAGMSSTERGGNYGIIERRRQKPLIAAVEGFAVGGGMEVVLACDLVVASTTASFGLPEVHRSLVPTCGGMFRAPRALPLNVAREMLLTGDPIDAERAERLGFVNRLVGPGEAARRGRRPRPAHLPQRARRHPRDDEGARTAWWPTTTSRPGGSPVRPRP